MKAVRIARRMLVVRCEVHCRTGGATWSGSHRGGMRQARAFPASYSRSGLPYARSGAISKVLLYLSKSGSAGVYRRTSVSIGRVPQ